MSVIQRLVPFVAACLMLLSINVSAAPNKVEDSGALNTAVVNINTATLEQLESLTGIGESKARAIIAYRDEQGKFKSVEDLSKIRGISDNTVVTLIQKNPNRIVAK